MFMWEVSRKETHEIRVLPISIYHCAVKVFLYEASQVKEGINSVLLQRTGCSHPLCTNIKCFYFLKEWGNV